MGKLLDDFLRTHHASRETISTTLYNELSVVEEELKKRKKQIEEANEVIRNNSINISSIASSTGIARRTFYNNDLLNEFVTENTTVNLSEREVVNRFKSKIDEQNRKITQLLHRDIDAITLENEISRTQSELANAQQRIRSLEEQHELDVTIMNRHGVRMDDPSYDDDEDSIVWHNNGGSFMH